MSTTDVNEELFFVNGLNAVTGDYGLEPMSDEAIAAIIAGDDDTPPPEKLDNLSTLKDKLLQKAQREELPGLNRQYKELETRLKTVTDEAERTKIEAEMAKIYAKIELIGDFGVKAGVDPKRLAFTGWGIVFPASMPSNEVAQIKEQLEPLLGLRRHQVETGEVDDKITIDKYGNEQQKETRAPFKIFEGPNGYIEGKRFSDFLGYNYGTVTGPVDPSKGVPYYLLLVGNPEQIPYRFQYQLDVQYAVGRIHFDELADYGRYAASVVAVETGAVILPHQVSFFSVENKGDKSTEGSSAHLVKPLYETIKRKALDPAWSYQLYEGEETTKEALKQLFAAKAETRPALLFTASHGMEFPKGHPQQVSHQGALVCHNWPGPQRWRKPFPPEFYFSADDITAEVDVTGMIAFVFACYGAGTPQVDDFARLKAKGDTQRAEIAEKPFLAKLPQALLRQGALAVVGHIERAWGHSFYTKGAGEQLSVFESTLEGLMRGFPLGAAVEYFNERYAELATILNTQLDDIQYGSVYDPKELVSLWTAHNDARNYIIIGDPAVRAMIAEVTEFTATTPPKTQTTPIRTIASEKTLAQAVDVDGSFSASSTDEADETLFKKPASISDEDWANTPLSIKQFVQRAIALIEHGGGERLPRKITMTYQSPLTIEEAGWGVIVAPTLDAGITQALQPLLIAREAQAGTRYQQSTYQAGETAYRFRQRHSSMPYYWLIVGSPAEIPYQFQHHLAMQSAVGRLHFDDPTAYRAYVEHLLQPKSPPSTAHVVASTTDDPLWREAMQRLSKLTKPMVSTYHEQTTYTLTDPPPFLLTTLTPTLPPDTPLRGLMALLYGNCTVGMADFHTADPHRRQRLTDQPQVNSLAQKMLQQGAKAVLGTVHPVFGYSFVDPIGGLNLTTLESCLKRLAEGASIGAAMDYLGQWHAEIGAQLAELRQASRMDEAVDEAELRTISRFYTEVSSWTLLGDPAATL